MDSNISGQHVPPLKVPAGEILRYETSCQPYWSGCGGTLFSGDCLEYLREIKDAIADTVFIDPPFNLNKKYGGRFVDKMSDEQYLSWSKRWLAESIRVLKPGGAVFLYNLPRWNLVLGAFLMEKGLEFRHWIAISAKTRLPIYGRLYPAHYGLLYFTKGKPKTFHRIRTPIATCRHCGHEIRDYGGHRSAMHPDGVSLMDIWDDIPPVRHKKYKSAKRSSNALSTKLLDRVIEMSTNEGDIVLDPFGGSGTTYWVAWMKKRRWIGIELDHPDVIIERLTTNSTLAHANGDLVDGANNNRPICPVGGTVKCDCG